MPSTSCRYCQHCQLFVELGETWHHAPSLGSDTRSEASHGTICASSKQGNSPARHSRTLYEFPVDPLIPPVPWLAHCLFDRLSPVPFAQLSNKRKGSFPRHKPKTTELVPFGFATGFYAFWAVASLQPIEQIITNTAPFFLPDLTCVSPSNHYQQATELRTTISSPSTLFSPPRYIALLLPHTPPSSSLSIPPSRLSLAPLSRLVSLLFHNHNSLNNKPSHNDPRHPSAQRACQAHPVPGQDGGSPQAESIAEQNLSLCCHSRPQRARKQQPCFRGELYNSHFPFLYSVPLSHPIPPGVIVRGPTQPPSERPATRHYHRGGR